MPGKLPLDESPSSYYITITVPSPPKIKIKIPNLVAKTMQKRFDKRREDDEDSSDKRAKLLTLHTVRSIFTNAFHTKKRCVNKREGKPGRFDLKCLYLKHVTQENDCLELCKKRILMGSKCKPLTLSGALHYDKHGVLLPERIP